MDKETLKYVLTEAEGRPLPTVVPRTLALPLDSGKVVTLVGIRRSGKTYLLYEAMGRLEAQGVDRRRMVYLNFEDDRLQPVGARDYDLILRAHEELHPEVADQTRYFFFDEVQNAPHWERFVRRLSDTTDAHVFVTGSASHLLVRDLAAGLRGRSISYEVFPLSFAEFLAFRGIERVPYSRTSDSRMAAALDEYLDTGGLPEVALAEPALRPRILKEYVDLVFYKDLIERYRIGNAPVMRQLLRHCLAQPATLLNVHKLYHDFKSQGLELSKDTLYRYLESLEESYVIFTAPVAARSLRTQAINPKKLHPIDWALGYPFIPQRRIDLGRRLETAVFLHWRRQRDDLAYLGGEREVDLVIDPRSPEALINVAYSVTDPATWARELSGLDGAVAGASDVARVLVVHESAARTPPAGIEVVDAWRYLLGEIPS